MYFINNYHLSIFKLISSLDDKSGFHNVIDNNSSYDYGYDYCIEFYYDYY